MTFRKCTQVLLPAAFALLCVPGCASAGQDGPLMYGNAEGVVESKLCGPNDLQSTQIYYAQPANNPSDKVIEILAVSLLEPHNVTQDAGLAAPFPEAGATAFYIHFAEPTDAEDNVAIEWIDRMRPAVGFSIPPKGTALLAVKASVNDPEADTSVLQMVVEYKVDGKKFTEKNGMSWQTTESECDE